jgi:hypothetical protein
MVCMNLKKLLLIASLFVTSSLHATPLIWNFVGTAGPDSTFEENSIEGLSFNLQIFLNTNLVGHKEPGSVEVFFNGPFEGQVIINFPGHPFGVVPVDTFGSVANFMEGGQVTSVVTFQTPLGFGEQFVLFDQPISSNPFHLTPIPQTPTSAGSFLNFTGPNDLEVFGNVTSFSAVLNTVPEVDSTALLLTSALVALGFVRTQAKQRGRKQIA